MSTLWCLLGSVQSGDIFQLVLSQRYERRTFADPFEVYRALRVVNPSPYMVYMQARGCIIVSSSPEILCRYVHSTHSSVVGAA
jgi:anthranilate synthase component 1